MSDEQQPWEWPEEIWRGKVNRVRAGRSLKPATWPGGARCAVALSFDVDHETNELRDGGQSIGAMSRGQYGNRQGVPRIMEILRRHDVKASFYVPAVVALLYPDETRMFADEGHEVGIHGWIHERNSILPPDAERELQMRSADTLETIAGVRPVGIRTPSWDFSPATLEITRDMGLLYDSSLMADVDCHELLLDGGNTGVVELPVEWIRDDAVYFNMNRFSALRPYTPPEAVFDIFLREFEAAHAEGGLFQLTMHPHVTGYRSRIWILERLIERIEDTGDAWFATHAQVVAWARDNAA
ncbi:polysaccharide deacetylase [Kaustia mangrovi]|uniref:Chitooligosaccharide deacetylase n=1 Tax=Kaustia mangrovi TaxID=2593653 RepID=A0A7S8C404_9HYPH|nr:polysaccharide deacetylase [Kaustia mangrovi]QPC42983.1 polysaccharide deacetylase [Kaustia mangrovi]